MATGPNREVDWTIRTVGVAALVSIAAYLFATVLRTLGAWPDLWYSEFIFGGISGATAVHRMHPGRPLLVLLVFGTVMSVLLLLGRIVFGWYLLKESV